MKTWITADWHLGDTRLELLGRHFPDLESMYIDLRDKHNSLVKPDDLVIMVGDVLSKVSDIGRWLPTVATFNGKKILIRGNHDETISDALFAPYFEKIVPEGDGMEMMIGGIPCWLTHYPTKSRADLFNLVGHIHGRWHVQKNMMNVGVDVTHFYPTPDTNVTFHYNGIINYYDEDVWVANHPANLAHNGRGKKGSYSDKLIPGTKG